MFYRIYRRKRCLDIMKINREKKSNLQKTCKTLKSYNKAYEILIVQLSRNYRNFHFEISI